MKRVLVTGANGFIGRALCERLHRDGCWDVIGAVRAETASSLPDGIKTVEVGSIGPHTDWSNALSDIDFIVHLAARVHVMKETSKNPIAEYRDVNVLGIERLARMAAQRGVKRFIFVSTIKVNGEETRDRPFTAEDIPNPQDPYAISKWEAEKVLTEISKKTGLHVVVVRSPMVYGPFVKGNFIRLLQLVKTGLPLPLGSIKNRRSFIYVENLVDLVIRA